MGRWSENMEAVTLRVPASMDDPPPLGIVHDNTEKVWDAKCIGFLERNDSSNRSSCSMFLGPPQFTAYTFKIMDGQMKWLIERRYSDYMDLHDVLHAAGPADAVPPLPSKWDRFLQSMLPTTERGHQRAQLLQDYTTNLCLLSNGKMLPIKTFLTNRAKEKGLWVDPPPLSPSSFGFGGGASDRGTSELGDIDEDLRL